MAPLQRGLLQVFVQLACAILLFVAGATSQDSSPSASVPSAAQASSALEAGGVGIGNNPVQQALGKLAASKSDLQNALNSGLANSLGRLVGGLLNPELQYSYGRSPPVYPTPQGAGGGDWASAYSKARDLVSQMTDQEKNNITYGISDTAGCSGFSGGVPRLGFPGLCLNDASSGVRTGQLVNGYPSGISVGASWNRSSAHERGLRIGREFKTKGINVALGPVVGPLGRVVKGGRIWEGFSTDPYLSGGLVAPTIEGMQESVIACVKHYITNEQETNRLPFLAGYIPDLFTQSVSSNVDDKTLHETYLWPFYDAVKAGVGSVMCSYNRINNSYGCQNSKLMNGLLKTELGFEGFVVSDWNAQHTGIAGANAGLDMAMPTSIYWSNNVLAKAVKNGSVTADRLSDMAVRIVAAWYRFAEIEAPGQTPRAGVDARDPAAEPILFQSAVEGHVLVKNSKNALPLNKPRVLSLFGFDGPGGLNKSSSTSFASQNGLANTPNYTNGAPFTDLDQILLSAEVEPDSFKGPQVALAGTLITGGGSGAITPASSISPFDAFLTQAKTDGTTLYMDFYSQKPKVNQSSDACIVFINEQAGETWDRAGLADPYADRLVTNVASQCPNTIVVIHNAGVRLVDNWFDNVNITGVIFGHTPGQSSGAALTEIIYGRQSPSGRLPYTVAKQESDYGSLLDPSLPTFKDPQFPQSDFTEGSFIDYKSFIKRGVTPRFPFGFGLTYANFAYSALQINRNTNANTGQLPPDATANSSQPAPEGGLTSLYDVVATVTATVQNTGGVPAAEVAQLYVGIPDGGQPEKVLRGFDKQLLQPQQSATFSFPLRRRDLSVWDTGKQQWILPSAGPYKIMVGKDVLDIQLEGTLTL